MYCTGTIAKLVQFKWVGQRLIEKKGCQSFATRSTLHYAIKEKSQMIQFELVNKSIKANIMPTKLNPLTVLELSNLNWKEL